MKKVDYLRINTGFFPLPVCVFDNQSSLNAFVKANEITGVSPEDRGTLGTTMLVVRNGEGFVLIRIMADKERGDIAILETVVHEASHAVDMIFSFIGEHEPGTETRAYLLQDIVGKTVRWLEGRG